METQDWVMMAMIRSSRRKRPAVSLVNSRQDEDLDGRVESLSSRVDDLESRPGTLWPHNLRWSTI